jgi:hypothetical protein
MTHKRSDWGYSVRRAFSIGLGLCASLAGRGCDESCPPPACAGNAVRYCSDDGGVPVIDCQSSLNYYTTDCSIEGLACAEGNGTAACVSRALTPCDPSSPSTAHCANGTEIETTACTAVGYLRQRTDSCAERGGSCVEANGAAACVDKTLGACDPEAQGDAYAVCSEDGSAVIYVTCLAVGYPQPFDVERCDDPSQACVAVGDGAECVVVPVEACDPAGFAASARCEGEFAVSSSCTSIGFVTEDWLECYAGLVCVQKDDHAACVLDALLPCTADVDDCVGNVARHQLCSDVGYVTWELDDDCSSYGLTCTVDADGWVHCA